MITLPWNCISLQSRQYTVCSVHLKKKSLFFFTIKDDVDYTLPITSSTLTLARFPSKCSAINFEKTEFWEKSVKENANITCNGGKQCRKHDGSVAFMSVFYAAIWGTVSSLLHTNQFWGGCLSRKRHGLLTMSLRFVLFCWTSSPQPSEKSFLRFFLAFPLSFFYGHIKIGIKTGGWKPTR